MQQIGQKVLLQAAAEIAAGKAEAVVKQIAVKGLIQQ
jgi:hypothetical protein